MSNVLISDKNLEQALTKVATETAIAEQGTVDGMLIDVFGKSGGETSKKPIAVQHGGTGAKDAEAARNNLNAADKVHTHTASDITDLNIPTAGTEVPLANAESGSVGTSEQFARADHVHPGGSGGISGIAVSVKLVSSKWNDNVQTVSVAGVTAKNNIIISASPSDGKNFYMHDIYCSEQGEGTLTFKCATVPSADVTANILILG